MHKNKDYKTKREKIYDFVFKKKKIIILLSFIIALSIFIVSIFSLNKGGLIIIFTYPLALITFLFDLYYFKYFSTRMDGAIILILISILSFILGFFIKF